MVYSRRLRRPSHELVETSILDSATSRRNTMAHSTFPFGNSRYPWVWDENHYCRTSKVHSYIQSYSSNKTTSQGIQTSATKFGRSNPSTGTPYRFPSCFFKTQVCEDEISEPPLCDQQGFIQSYTRRRDDHLMASSNRRFRQRQFSTSTMCRSWMSFDNSSI